MGFGGGDLLDGERTSVEGCVLWETFLVRGPVRTALQVDGAEALQVPNLVAVDFTEVVLVLLMTEVAETVFELLGMEEV